MLKFRTLAFLSAAALAVLASQVQAGGRPGSVAVGCNIASKEFAGPVDITNTSSQTLKIGATVVVKVKTVYGTETEIVHIKSNVAPGGKFKGNNTYQNTTGQCTAVAYAKQASGYPKGS